MSIQSCESPSLGNFETLNLGVLGQNDIWVLALWPGAENIIRGRWWLPLNPGHGESCEFVFVHGSSMYQKCSNYVLTNLLFGLCRSTWISHPLTIRPNPHPGVLAHPFTPKVLWVRERALIFYPSIVFTLDSHFSLSRSLRVRHSLNYSFQCL